MFHEYPYSLYFSDIDRMCGLCHKAGYKLEVANDRLRLVDGKGNVISDVQITYADKALYDIDGNPIRSYILSASTGATTLVLTHGDGQVTTLTLPYATSAKEDTLGKDLTGYTYSVGLSGDDLLITRGDGTAYTITVPFATAAAETTTGRDLTTLAATLAVDGDNLVLRDTDGRELSRITVPYAVKALSDADGDTITTTYAATLETGTTTVTMKAKDGSTLSTITVPYATKALTDTEGNGFLSDYAEKLVIDGDGKRVGVEAHDGTRLSTITIPFATLAKDADKAVESVAIVGDNIVFTTHDGHEYSIIPTKAIKADRDGANNIITDTYVADVQNDPSNGSITFYDARGQVLATLTPIVAGATYDAEGNEISDYVKMVTADNQSDYILVTHGDGTVDSLLINYATKAWKDSLGQPIQNTYLTLVTIEPDEDDPTIMDLVGWNGDIPRAKVFATPLNDLFGNLAFKDSVEATYTPAGTITSTFTGTVSTFTVTPAGKTIKTVSTTGTLPSKDPDTYVAPTHADDSYTPGSKAADTYVAPSCTYNSNTQTLTFVAGSFTEGAYTPGRYTQGAFNAGSFTEGTFDPGALMTYADVAVADNTPMSGTITPDGTVTSTFTGTEATITSE